MTELRKLSFESLFDIVKKVFLKHGMLEPLVMEINYNYRNTENLDDYVALIIYQRERTSKGFLVSHSIISKNIDSLEYLLKKSIIEKQNQEF